MGNDGAVKKIMFVDDERQILRALNRLFMDSGYESVFMESGEDALRYLEQHTVDLVISDIRMPGMNGFDLLRKIKHDYPKTLRVALSGYTDSKNIYKALEENVAKMYMFKPWDNRELMNIIDNMFKLEGVLKDRKVMDLINGLDTLPTVPELYRKIKQMIQDDEDVEKISKLIESDQASSSKILRIANSAFYGAKTGSIGQAVMYIGLANVKNIVLSNAIFNFQGKYKEDLKKLWNSATITNQFTSLFYQEFLDKKIPNIFASAGLLHNIGMVVLLTNHSMGYLEMYSKALNGEGNLLDMEQEALGITHQELGGYLLNWWEIPLPIVEAAMYHHTPLNENIINKELVSVVHLANIHAWRKLNSKSPGPEYEKECCERLEVNPEKVATFFEAYTELPKITD